MTDSKILGAAVQTWLDAGDAPGMTIDTLDEADAALERVLIEQGILEAGHGSHFEPGTYEHGLLHIFLEDDTIIQIDVEGKVTKC